MKNPITWIKDLYKNRLIVEKVDETHFKTRRGDSNYTFYELPQLLRTKSELTSSITIGTKQLKTTNNSLKLAKKAGFKV